MQRQNYLFNFQSVARKEQDMLDQKSVSKRSKHKDAELELIKKNNSLKIRTQQCTKFCKQTERAVRLANGTHSVKIRIMPATLKFSLDQNLKSHIICETNRNGFGFI